MSNKIKLLAKTNVKYKENFWKKWSTFEVSEDLHKELEKTRFFRHKCLEKLEVKKEKNQEKKK